MKLLRCIAVLVLAASALANAPPYDPERVGKERRAAAAAFAREDAAELRALLDRASLYAKQDVALHLGRLGDRAALPRLRALDREWRASPACRWEASVSRSR